MFTLLISYFVVCISMYRLRQTMRVVFICRVGAEGLALVPVWVDTGADSRSCRNRPLSLWLLCAAHPYWGLSFAKTRGVLLGHTPSPWLCHWSPSPCLATKRCHCPQKGWFHAISVAFYLPPQHHIGSLSQTPDPRSTTSPVHVFACVFTPLPHAQAFFLLRRKMVW